MRAPSVPALSTIAGCRSVQTCLTWGSIKRENVDLPKKPKVSPEPTFKSRPIPIFNSLPQAERSKPPLSHARAPSRPTTGIEWWFEQVSLRHRGGFCLQGQSSRGAWPSMNKFNQSCTIVRSKQGVQNWANNIGRVVIYTFLNIRNDDLLESMEADVDEFNQPNTNLNFVFVYKNRTITGWGVQFPNVRWHAVKIGFDAREWAIVTLVKSTRTILASLTRIRGNENGQPLRMRIFSGRSQSIDHWNVLLRFCRGSSYIERVDINFASLPSNRPSPAPTFSK